MNNVSKKIRQAYYDLLNGQLTYGGVSVEVFKEDVYIGYGDNHVVIRMESETGELLRGQVVNLPVVITEVVAVSPSSMSVDPDIVEDLDDQVKSILYPSVGSRKISANGFEVCLVRPLSSHYLNEDDGTKRYYRKITRWQQRTTQSN